MEILRIENLNFSYPKTEKKALDDINLSIDAGEFIVVCGESGCGKTTLLKLIKKELAPIGEKSGKIFYEGKEQNDIDARESASEIGYVLQNPDSQIVTDKVWHELAFGLENLGIPTETIRRRVGEMASYFGITDWFRKKTDELSGGQKQILNLASVMVMQPKILLLDEPTSQLDPIAASDFIATLQKLNRELGLTVILAEHRLEEVFPICDRVLMLEDGKKLLFEAPRDVGTELKKIDKDHRMMLGLPSAVRIFDALDIDDVCPLTVREGRDFLEKHFLYKKGTEDKIEEYTHSENVMAEFKNVWFRYEKDLPDVLRNTNLKVYSGEIFCILGGNGTGKTTTLNVLSGLDRAYRGKVLIDGKKIKDYKGNSLYRGVLAFLPQNPETVFVRDTVRADFDELLSAMGLKKEERTEKIEKLAKRLSVSHLLDRNPYDISGGEQQKCALMKTLLSDPKILLLDEPTKGLDAYSKKNLADIIKELKSAGMTIIAVTHDVEFASEVANRCALFFDGEILSADVPRKFFSENNFYTTASNRMARSIFRTAVTSTQVIDFCLKGGKKE